MWQTLVSKYARVMGMWIFWRYLVWLFAGNPTVAVEDSYDRTNTIICPVEIIAGVPIIRRGRTGVLLREDGMLSSGERWRDLIGRVPFDV